MLFSLYKSHILPFIESGMSAYYHAHPSILKLIDEIQDSFCESMHISKRDAMLDFNLAPLALRRDIEMLGILHKVALGIAPMPLQELFKQNSCDLQSFGFHNGTIFHSRKLRDSVGVNSPVMMKRSLFGLVFVYNRLAQSVVNANSVKQFSRRLLCIVKECIDNNPKWEFVFHRI